MRLRRTEGRSANHFPPVCDPPEYMRGTPEETSTLPSKSVKEVLIFQRHTFSRAMILWVCIMFHTCWMAILDIPILGKHRHMIICRLIISNQEETAGPDPLPQHSVHEFVGMLLTWQIFFSAPPEIDKKSWKLQCVAIFLAVFKLNEKDPDPTISVRFMFYSFQVGQGFFMVIFHQQHWSVNYGPTAMAGRLHANRRKILGCVERVVIGSNSQAQWLQPPPQKKEVGRSICYLQQLQKTVRHLISHVLYDCMKERTAKGNKLPNKERLVQCIVAVCSVSSGFHVWLKQCLFAPVGPSN